ncbi:hypothetical protein CMK11_10350 [Candidatus Poribacteria bacterium]|nr:hypothetical protein [Candidatus Poribacteria bacterium]
MRHTRFTSRLAACVTTVGLAFTLANVSFAVIDPETAVGIWLFDEGSGGNAADSSEMGLDADLIASPDWVDGPFGKALLFDGAASYVKVPDHENPSEALTLSAWVQSTTPGWSQNGWMIEKRDAYILHPDQGGVLVAFPVCNGGCWNLPGGWNDGAAGPADITEWHMYTGTFDSANGEWKLYVDAELLSELEVSKTPLVVDAGPVNIGFDDCCGGDRYGAAAMDEVAIFNVALPQEDIETMYELGIGMGVLAVDPREKAVTTWAVIKQSQ